LTSLSTPAAIVLGFGLFGVLTGLGLYFGLRDHPAGASSAPAAMTEPAPTSQAVGTTMPVPTVAALEGSVSSEGARHAIEAQHAHLVEKCWNPSVAQRALPGDVKLTITLDYAADGRLAIHSLQQDMAKARPDVTMCVDKELILPVVAPPGRRVRVVVPIAFP
jgi:hypothetical protein